MTAEEEPVTPAVTEPLPAPDRPGPGDGGPEPERGPELDEDTGVPETPARSAVKADWVAYAVTLGADPAEAEGMTKAELIAGFGEPEPEPHYYLAGQDLFIGDPAESGTLPVRAFSAGDRVLPADVYRNGWRDLVSRPEEKESSDASTR
jgi:hypothetical protein